MSQDTDRQWLDFAQHVRDLVDVTSEVRPTPYGTGNPKQLRELVISLNVSRVLDLGCSAGCWAPIFEGCEYYGLEQERETLDYAIRNVPHGNYVVAYGEALPFASETFDLIWTSHVLQHSSHYPEKDVMVREIWRVLKPLGYYLCVENTSDDATHLDKSMNSYGWKTFMVSRGFTFINEWPEEEYLFRKERC